MFTGNRSIAHFDLDAFYVHVEYLRNPKLRGRPIAVGGQSDRGVIASCSYEARHFGVRSAMPAKLAKRLCPELMIIRGDMENYIRHSNLVTDIIRSETPLFEKSSIDEFYIDLSGMDRFFGCFRYIQQLHRKIVRESGLQMSYALATNKLISKVATNEKKPNAHERVEPGLEKAFLGPLPIEKMPMIGKQTAALLRQMGVETIAVLSCIPAEMLINLLGKNGVELWRRAQGIDDSPVVPFHEQKSMSTENTFDTDTINIPFLQRELGRMTERLAFDLRTGNKLTGCITVKIRYSDFQTMTMQSSIPYTANDELLMQKARELFHKLYDRRLLIRLIGVRFTNLVSGSYQINIFDDNQESIRLYQAIDSVKKQFGEQILIRGACI
ncbi:MAG TPA: DNA polymerase IV [Puia sp.]|nr:DNA polymerase IV [Puia sp.]